MGSHTSDPSMSYTNSIVNDEDDASQVTHHDNESDSEMPSTCRRRRRRSSSKSNDTTTNTTENGNEDIRSIPIKELLKNKKRRRSMMKMPSTIKRLEEQKKQRLSKNEPSDTEDGKTNEKEQETSQTSTPPEPTTTTATEEAEEAPITQPNETENPTVNENENEDENEDENGNGEVVAPQVKIDENGNIIIDQSSLFVSSNNNADEPSSIVNTVEHDPFGSRVTSASFKKRESSMKWTTADTDRFYEGLRSFGTDFSLMTHLFPKRSRRQLKLKFKREERDYSKRIDAALSAPRVPIPTNLPKLGQVSTTEKENDGDANGAAEQDQNQESSKENGADANGDNDEEKEKTVDKPQGQSAQEDEIIGRVSDDEEVMLDNFEAPPDDFDDDDGFDSDD